MTLCARLSRPGVRLKAGEAQGGAGTPLPAAALLPSEDFKQLYDGPRRTPRPTQVLSRPLPP